MIKGFLDCLKREQDIFIKPSLSSGKMAFMCNPALIYVLVGSHPRIQANESYTITDRVGMGVW